MQNLLKTHKKLVYGLIAGLAIIALLGAYWIQNSESFEGRFQIRTQTETVQPFVDPGTDEFSGPDTNNFSGPDTNN